MKKFVAILLVIAMTVSALALVSCNEEEAVEENKNKPANDVISVRVVHHSDVWEKHTYPISRENIFLQPDKSFLALRCFYRAVCIFSGRISGATAPS